MDEVALSIRQPWAWLIVAGHKPVENRSWPTKQRGRVFVHASSRYRDREHSHYCAFIRREFGVTLPPLEELGIGGIIGSVTLADCVRDYPSKWAERGKWHFVMRDPRPLPFFPVPGRLSFFRVFIPKSVAA